jgi:hypothetical protein
MTFIQTTQNFVRWNVSGQYKADNERKSCLFSVKKLHNIEGNPEKIAKYKGQEALGKLRL